MKTLILGVGNPILTDDAVGICVANEIKKLSLPHVEVIETSLAGISLLDYVVGYERLIIIDSIKTEKEAPGTLYKLKLEDIGNSATPSYSHEMNIRTAIELGRNLGYKMPKIIEIYAIEIKDNTTFGEECNPAVKSKIPGIVDEITKIIKSDSPQHSP
jgi:hydrogenase maturation protease